MKAVNLLPNQTPSRRKRRIDSLAVSGGVVTLAVAAAVAGGFVLEHRHARSEQQQLAAARSTLAQLKAQKGPTASLPPLAAPTVLGQQKLWRQAVETALSTRVPVDRTLAQLADVVPGDVTLSSLSLGQGSGSSTGTSSTTGSANSLTLSGRAASHTAVATLLSRLALVPGLTQIELGPTAADPATGAITFQIQAQVSA